MNAEARIYSHKQRRLSNAVRIEGCVCNELPFETHFDARVAHEFATCQCCKLAAICALYFGIMQPYTTHAESKRSFPFVVRHFYAF